MTADRKSVPREPTQPKEIWFKIFHGQWLAQSVYEPGSTMYVPRAAPDQPAAKPSGYSGVLAGDGTPTERLGKAADPDQPAAPSAETTAAPCPVHPEFTQPCQRCIGFTTPVIVQNGAPGRANFAGVAPPSSDDLCARLRAQSGKAFGPWELCLEAAARIEALTNENWQLQRAEERISGLHADAVRKWTHTEARVAELERVVTAARDLRGTGYEPRPTPTRVAAFDAAIDALDAARAAPTRGDKDAD